MARRKKAERTQSTRRAGRKNSGRKKRPGRSGAGKETAEVTAAGDSLPRNKKVRIGTYFVLKGLLSKNQARRILKEQQEATGPIKPRFGSLAVKKGYISRRQAERGFLEMSRRETLGY